MKKFALFLAVALATCSVTLASSCQPLTCRKAKQTSYTTSCGFMGWSRCTRYRTGYVQDVCGQKCDCTWGAWEDASSCGACSSSCGGGMKQCLLRRSVTQEATNGGKTCSGSSTMTEERTCNTQACPVDCEWTKWTNPAWSSCSADCGGGKKTRVLTRSVKQQAAHGGRKCEGEGQRVEEADCNTHPCPIDCKWTQWSEPAWGICSSECGGGRKTRVLTRKQSPAAAHGGKECDGSDKTTEEADCNTHPCPIDCKWTKWSDPAWSACSASCGGAKKTRVLTRTQNPAAAHGGKECEGSDRKTEETDCNTQPCPIDGGWTDWSVFTQWSACDSNCNQTRHRSRTCTSPAPAHGGAECQGNTHIHESRDCYEGACLDEACLAQANNRASLPRNCGQFVVCVEGGHVVQDCWKGTHWNQTLSTCVHQASSTCKDSDEEEVTTTTKKPNLEDCIWPKYTVAGKDCKPCTENFVDVDECTNYYIWCAGGLGYKMQCAAGTHYNTAAGYCDHGECP